MAIPNLIGLLLLSKVVVAETEDFFATKYKDEKSNEEKAA
jgi:Na+/alanine symporter